LRHAERKPAGANALAFTSLSPSGPAGRFRTKRPASQPRPHRARSNRRAPAGCRRRWRGRGLCPRAWRSH